MWRMLFLQTRRVIPSITPSDKNFCRLNRRKKLEQARTSWAAPSTTAAGSFGRGRRRNQANSSSTTALDRARFKRRFKRAKLARGGDFEAVSSSMAIWVWRTPQTRSKCSVFFHPRQAVGDEWTPKLLELNSSRFTTRRVKRRDFKTSD